MCDANNSTVWDGINVQSGCLTVNGFLCDSYSPKPVIEQPSYGFAIMNGTQNYCKCFQLTWRSGAATGKQTVTQASNGFDLTGGLEATDMVILSSGGGHGPKDAGCNKQYGTA